jgi:hypothetical protein
VTQVTAGPWAMSTVREESSGPDDRVCDGGYDTPVMEAANGSARDSSVDGAHCGSAVRPRPYHEHKRGS